MQVPYSPVPGVAPSTSVPNDALNVQATPADAGAQVGQALQGVGSAVSRAGEDTAATAFQFQTRFNNVVSDAAFNRHQTNVNNILYGDPDHPEVPGYYGLHGQAALDARPGVQKALEESRAAIATDLNPAQALIFNEASRRINLNSMNGVGSHYEQEFNRYAVETQDAGIGIKSRAVANGYNDDNLFLHNLEDAGRAADAKSALQGADPNTQAGKDIFANNRLVAAQTLYTARAVAMGTADPGAGLAFIQKNSTQFDAITLHRLEGEFKAGADRQAVAGAINDVTGRPVAAAGGSNTGPIANATLPPEAQKFLPALSGGEGNYGSPAPKGDRSDTPIDQNRYQFLSATWRGAAPGAGVDVNDKSPAAQDAVAWSHAQAVYKANTGGNLQADIAAGGNEAKIAGALNKVWPSLPGGSEQNTTMAQFTARMAAAGGAPASAPGLGSVAPATHDPAPYGIEFQQMQHAHEVAAQKFPDRPDLQRQVVEGVWQNIQQTNVLQAKYEAAQAKAKIDAQQKVGDQIFRMITADPKNFDPHIIANDGTLTPEEKIRYTGVAQTLLERAQGKGEPLAAISHQNTTELNRRLTLPDGDSNKITDMRPIDEAFNNGLLTTQNYGFLRQQFADARTGDGDRLGQTMQRFLTAVKPSIEKSNPLMGTLDMTGGTEYFRLQHDVSDKVAQYRKEGKNPYDLFDPSKPDYVGAPASLAQYQKSIPESLSDYTTRMKAATPPPATPRPSLDKIFGR